MRAITKGSCGLYPLEKANDTPPETDQEARSRWSSFGHKSALSDLLANEQYGLCAYSEINPEHYDLGTHIEHVKPKSRYPEKTFDYQNLILSALSSSDLKSFDEKDEKSTFGGHHKQSQYDETLFVSCLTGNSSDYFIYLSNGEVEPKRSLLGHDKIRAKYTIDLLNLNSPYLVAERRRWLDELDTLIDEHINQGLPVEHLAAIYLLPRNQRLDSFFTANRQRFMKTGDKLIAQEAPELD